MRIPFFVYNIIGDNMEELPQKAKTVMGIYATAVTAIEGTAAYIGANRDDLIVILAAVVVIAAVSSYVYIRLYFKHYRYCIDNGVITIKKGALFKRRHLIYVDKISSITISENFVQRWFGLCTVWFHMSGNVVKLSYVLIEKSDELQKVLDSRD